MTVKSMDDFFKGVSGELKKIITSVSSFLTVIKKKKVWVRLT